ncbi:MAG: hypothetical protein ACRDZ9_07380, partial [Acidimicrobiales bacterium]
MRRHARRPDHLPAAGVLLAAVLVSSLGVTAVMATERLLPGQLATESSRADLAVVHLPPGPGSPPPPPAGPSGP